MPAFDANREITWESYVEKSNPKNNKHDLIIGRDLMHEIGIDLLFSESVMRWNTATVPMAPISKLEEDNITSFEEELMFAHDPLSTGAERIQTILDAKYTPADLKKISQECKE